GGGTRAGGEAAAREELSQVDHAEGDSGDPAEVAEGAAGQGPLSPSPSYSRVATWESERIYEPTKKKSMEMRKRRKRRLMRRRKRRKRKSRRRKRSRRSRRGREKAWFWYLTLSP